MKYRTYLDVERGKCQTIYIIYKCPHGTVEGDPESWFELDNNNIAVRKKLLDEIRPYCISCNDLMPIASEQSLIG